MGGVLGNLREGLPPRENGETATKKPVNSDRFLSVFASQIPEDAIRPSPTSSRVSSPTVQPEKDFEDARKQTDRDGPSRSDGSHGAPCGGNGRRACPKGGRGPFAVTAWTRHSFEEAGNNWP